MQGLGLGKIETVRAFSTSIFDDSFIFISLHALQNTMKCPDN